MAKRSIDGLDTDVAVDTKARSSVCGSTCARSTTAGRLVDRLDNLRSYLGTSLRPTQTIELDARARLSIDHGRVVTRG